MTNVPMVRLSRLLRTLRRSEAYRARFALSRTISCFRSRLAYASDSNAENVTAT